MLANVRVRVEGADDEAESCGVVLLENPVKAGAETEDVGVDATQILACGSDRDEVGADLVNLEGDPVGRLGAQPGQGLQGDRCLEEGRGDREDEAGKRTVRGKNSSRRLKEKSSFDRSRSFTSLPGRRGQGRTMAFS